MARKSGKSGKGLEIFGISVMSMVSIATLVFVILNFTMVEESKKNTDFLVTTISAAGGDAAAARKMNAMKMKRQ